MTRSQGNPQGERQARFNLRVGTSLMRHLVITIIRLLNYLSVLNMIITSI
jgi:hypothetical protein